MAKGWNETPARVYQSMDSNGLIVWVEVNFNLSTLAIVNPGVTVHRDPGCELTYLVLGFDEVRHRTEFGPVADGDTTIGRGQLNGAGFDTVQDVTNAGIYFQKGPTVV